MNKGSGLCYAGAALGFSAGNLFYDALLLEVSRGREVHRISALGYGVGYLGGACSSPSTWP